MLRNRIVFKKIKVKKSKKEIKVDKVTGIK